jgi:hypothetical protein
MNARQRRRAIRAWRIRAEVHAYGGRLPVVELDVYELQELLDYSLTIPTGASPGRSWRTNVVQFVRHCYGYQKPKDRARFARLLLPPSWLRASWVRATVLDEPDHMMTYPIRHERVRLVARPPNPGRPQLATIRLAPATQFRRAELALGAGR